ncbi:MAG: AsnC family transcriptional regulator [Synergistaceae bacterium]|jgi:Lrp/AsnC family leucine-responsive transcriptional regulator|nr:AsnC family transcriptional regulator [Synergistaceae bacterium]
MLGDKLFDDIGLKILLTLQKNARISFSDLGRRVGLSSPAVAERIHRMEEAGYIKEYRTIVDTEKIGFPITAFISVTASVGRLGELDDVVRLIPEVLEAYHLSGTEDLMLKIVAATMTHLEEIINQVGNFGETRTSLVLSSPVTSRMITPLPRSAAGSR